MIILHHSLTKDSGTVSWQAIRRYHIETMKWDDIGYHYGLEMIGTECEVLVGRPLDVIGAHTRGYNSYSVGICCVGNYDGEHLPGVMFEKLVPLVRSLMHTFHIPLSAIRRHAEFAPKTCPGTLFPMLRLLSELQKELDHDAPHVSDRTDGFVG
jgi:Negative regulator of beta-lactamase expression